MNKKLLQIGIPCICVLAAIVVCILIFFQHKTSQPTQSTETFMPPVTDPPPIRPDVPGFKSPYNKDEQLFWCMMPVFPGKLNVTNIKVTTTTNPDAEFVIYVDAEDILTFTFPTQSDDIDIAKIQIIGIAHENMLDPYTTPLSDYTERLFECEVSVVDDNAIAEVMIGYNTNAQELIDVLFVYDGKIEYYTMFTFVADHKGSYLYWSQRYPDETIRTFHMVRGDETVDCYYIEEDGVTLYDWIDQNTCVGEWRIERTCILDIDKKWLISEEQCSMVLTDGCTITAQPYRDDYFTNFEFEPTNSQYAVSYLGKTKEDIVATFGNPSRSTINGGLTRLEYENLIFYITTNGVSQIDIRNGSLQPINGLPYLSVTAQQINDACQAIGIDRPEVTDASDEEIAFYAEKRTFKNDGWNVCYVWESDEPILSLKNECIRIVVYTGENYY